MKLLMTNVWSNGPNTDVLTTVGTLAMPPKARLGIRFPVFASGKSSGVLTPVVDRVALSSAGAIVTPPRPAP